jgi:hypothetical protein
MKNIPKGLFTTGLDDLASKYLKNTNPADNNLITTNIISEMLQVAEALIVSPKVTFKVYGENVVLSLLAKTFGVNAIRTLIEEGAVDFILWRPMVLYTNDAKILSQGVCPLQSGNLTSTPHSDSLASAETGLNGWCNELTDVDRKDLAKTAAKSTILPSLDISHKAVAKVVEAYNSGALLSEGFNKDIPIHEIDSTQREILAKLGENAVEACVLVNQDLDIFEKQASWQILLKMIETLKTRGQIRNVSEEILQLERIPSIPSLISTGKLDWADILKIRKARETDEFRKWIWSQPNPTDLNAVSEEYLKYAAPRVDFKNTGWFKAARISSISVVGGVVGGAVGGPLGGLVGATMATGIGTLLSLADGMLIDPLLSRPNPRRFSTDILAPFLMNNSKRLKL